VDGDPEELQAESRRQRDIAREQREAARKMREKAARALERAQEERRESAEGGDG
jgi:hypothetical protein